MRTNGTARKTVFIIKGGRRMTVYVSSLPVSIKNWMKCKAGYLVPSIREVFSKVRREESRRRVILRMQESRNSADIENSALVSRGPDSEENRKKKKKKKKKKKSLGVTIVRNIGIPGKPAGKSMGGHRTRRRRPEVKAEHYKLWAMILKGNQ